MNINGQQPVSEPRQPKLQDSILTLEKITEGLEIASGYLLERLTPVSTPQIGVQPRAEEDKPTNNPPLVNRINTVCQSLEIFRRAIQDQLDRIEV